MKQVSGRLIVLMSAAMWFSACHRTQVAYPSRKDIIEAVYASGNILAEHEYRISAGSSGTIVSKLVDAGDTVRKGQLLFIIDDAGARQRLEAARSSFLIAGINMSPSSPVLADLQLAVRNAALKCSNDSLTYVRWSNLWKNDIGTKDNLDRAYTNYQVSINQKRIAEEKLAATRNESRLAHTTARSQLTTAESTASNYKVRSDRDGIVYETYAEQGENVRPDNALALVGDIDKRVIQLAVDQQDIERIRKGQLVLLRTENTGDTVYEATVSDIYPVMNKTEQTFRVDARFAGSPSRQFIHNSIEANIIIQEKKRALVIPRIFLAGKDSVWIRDNTSERRVRLKTGISTLDDIEVLSGIDEHTALLPANH